MSFEDLLSEFDTLSIEDQKKIKTLINNEYVHKANVVQLQSELNLLSNENNLIKQEVIRKFSQKEYQTIAFQLGRGIMDLFKGEKKLVDLPEFGLNLAIESMQRKNTDQLTNFQKKIYPIVEFKGLLAEKKFKKLSLAVLNNLIKKVDNTDENLQTISFEEGDGIVQSKKIDSTILELPEITEISQSKVVKDFILKEINLTEAKANKLKIACIMDEFTYFCFSPEAELLQLTPDNWLQEVNSFNPDILFVESAWQGKESLWKAKVSQNTNEIQQLIKFCKLNLIKTMFWNKEDPVHFGTFIDIAKQVDVVFTTDIDCIGKYKAEVGHDDVYLMPFAAQPQTHNPIEKYDRKDAFNFAGSFYLKYPERQRDFVNLTEVAIKSKSLDIYDRNFNNPHPHYTFPDQYKPFILGRLEPHEIDKAYKGYVYGINMNTIKQSQSMFARRVFEMVASNTIVLSNYSRGVRNFFGDLVLCSDNKDELQRKLDLITESDDTRDSFKVLGLRKVLAEHTYEDRMEYILSKLKIKHTLNRYKVCVVAKVEDLNSLEKILSMYNAQSYIDKNLVIYNPNTLQLDECETIHSFQDLSDLNRVLLQISPNYLTFFSEKDIYLADYLTDMMLSFKYLKSSQCSIVTKNCHYAATKNSIAKVQGEEYKFVENYKLKSSVCGYDKDDLSLVHNFIEDDEYQLNGHAFSIDRFNYVANCSKEIDSEELSVYKSNINGLDLGVELKQKLLPWSESIQPLISNQEQRFNFDLNYFKDNVVGNHKLIQVEHSGKKCEISSKLLAGQHRYIPLLTQQKNIGNQIEFFVKANGGLKSQVAVEFYNGNEKISFKIFEINQIENIQLPVEANSFDVSLRIKGNGALTLESIAYTVKPNVDALGEAEKNSSIITLEADVFKNELVKGKSNQIQFISEVNKSFVIKTTLAPAKHAYLYMKKIFTRDELNLVLNSEFEFHAKSSAEDVRIVFEFQDEHNQKISHSMNPILGGHALAIPLECKYIRLGLKVVGAGITEISKLDLGVVKNPINNFIPKSDVLVIAKQYPSYEDLYKYGFLHSRLKAYKQENKLVNMFKLTMKAEEFGFSEFEGVDVVSHNHAMLDKLLASGVYKKVCIHLIDNKMWEVVKKYQDTVQILVWIHGADIRSVSRREYEFDTWSAQELVRQKKLSDQRKAFWRKLLLSELHPNTQFIFVSQYFREESESDLEIKFPNEQCHIIHNYIDNQTFAYRNKPVSQRFKILSIRPFANKTYANDLTVNTILELSKRPNFNKFDIAIYGDGQLFDEVTEPLQKFSNVKLHKQFLTHSQIANLHKDYGIFLVPTRCDSQGVSRGEAMSSGLVPITSNIAAIPEFVDDKSGVLAPAEDYMAMAKGIFELSKNSKKFKELSANTSNRVNAQCGYKETVMKEIVLIR